MLQTEWNRIRSGIAQTPLDQSRYKVGVFPCICVILLPLRLSLGARCFQFFSLVFLPAHPLPVPQVPPPPENERDSLVAWQKAVDNAHAQLEQTHNRSARMCP